MNAFNLHYFFVMAGIVAFAITAVMAVTPKGIDFFGACVMGLVTAIGGGTIRDVILGVPVFWAADSTYIWVALFSSVAAFLSNRHMSRKEIYLLMLYLDALGISMFAIEGAQKVFALKFGIPLAPILLGVITAIGGGLLRDVLAGNTTLLMRREFYAIPVTMGCILYVILLTLLPERADWIDVGCAALIFGLRAAAIHWNLRVPNCLSTHSKQD